MKTLALFVAVIALYLVGQWIGVTYLGDLTAWNPPEFAGSP